MPDYLERRALARAWQLLDQFPAVAILGPRQVGKTTLASIIGKKRDAVYLDLESPRDLARLSDPELYLEQHESRLVILDEIHRVPEIYSVLRGLIDKGRRRGVHAGRFLILGSASVDLLRQSGESLAGRIAYVDLPGLGLLETHEAYESSVLWSRGGFPLSLMARSDAHSLEWREQFIRTYLERDVPALGPRVSPNTMGRLWAMLAHSQGGLTNASALARSLGVDSKTASTYADLLCDLLLARRLQPWSRNSGKRLTKSPKLYIRDAGITHALLGIRTYDELLGHPVAGSSWEGFVIENILSVTPTATRPYFYRASGGAEIDLVLDLPGNELWAVEIKLSLTPKPRKGFYHGVRDICPTRQFVVYPGTETYPLSDDVTAVPPLDLMKLLQGSNQDQRNME